MSRHVSTVVFVEHKDGKIHSGVYNAVTAATRLGGPVTALVLGSKAGIEPVVQKAASIKGVTTVVSVAGEGLAKPLADVEAPVIAATVKEGGFTHVVGAHTPLVKGVLPRAAALLDVAPISDITGIDSDNTFQRPVYAGNAIATVKSTDKVKLLTIRTTAFPPASIGGTAAITASTASDGGKPLSKWVGEQIAASDRPELAAAKVVVAGGRGMKSGDNFQLLHRLADALGGAVGASRAAVDAGFVGNDLQIGQTGKIVAPQLYIAVGISGAIQHLAGMKDSKTIVAINKDADAPIFQVADHGLVADLFVAVPEVTQKLSK